MMVYQHHERLDGKGYPVQIGGDEIHPWAKLCAVADVFDAITSARPYRKPMSLEDALDFFERRAGVAFDKEFVKCLSSLMRPN
jgi:HD-GYP domain-containing protein (c-di-GMP phosphodiesterase class II)